MSGSTDLSGARRQIDMCLDAGVNLIDTANVYRPARPRRSSARHLPTAAGDGSCWQPSRGSVVAGPTRECSRYHIINECEKSLRRLRTDFIDLYQLHQWDGQTPLEETLEALDGLVRSGKVRYIGCSNYSGWHLMKALGVAERHKYVRYVSQAVNYTLQAREAEYELVPIAVDQDVGILVWSPLAGRASLGQVSARPGTSARLASPDRVAGAAGP